MLWPALFIFFSLFLGGLGLLCTWAWWRGIPEFHTLPVASGTVRRIDIQFGPEMVITLDGAKFPFRYYGTDVVSLAEALRVGQRVEIVYSPWSLAPLFGEEAHQVSADGKIVGNPDAVREALNERMPLYRFISLGSFPVVAGFLWALAEGVGQH